MEQPDPHPTDLEVLRILRERDGVLTEVVLRSGEVLRCFNVARGYDIGDEFSHVTTNVSPVREGEARDFFFTSQVAALRDSGGRVLFEPRQPQPGERYELAVAEAKRIIDEADPEGLLAMGAPRDEYESYAADVARRLIHGEHPGDLAEMWEWRWKRRARRRYVEQLEALQARLRYDLNLWIGHPLEGATYLPR